MSHLSTASDQGRDMDIGLEMQDRSWQHMNGDNNRPSYHALPPIAAITTCRPSAARKEDHIFSVPNPPKPAGVVLSSQRAPTPFPDSQPQQQCAANADLAIPTPTAPGFPTSPQPQSPHSALCTLPTPDPASLSLQTIDQRHISSPHAYQNRVFPPSESANYPSSSPVDGSRSSTPQVPGASPNQSSHCGSYDAAQRTLTPRGTDYGRNTPGTPHSTVLCKEAPGTQVGVVVSSAGFYASDSSPRSFTPKHSPVPSPGPRNQGERGVNNQISSSQSPVGYNPTSLINYPPHANPRSYTPTSLPSLSITRTFGPPQIPTSSDNINRYPSHTKTVTLDNFPNLVQTTSSYKTPRTALQQAPRSHQGSIPQYPTPNVPISSDQGRFNYGDRNLGYGIQPSPGNSSQNNIRPHERMPGNFLATDLDRGKIYSNANHQQNTFVPPLATRISEQATLSAGEYSNFQGNPQTRNNYQSYPRHVNQTPSHSSSHASIKQQPQLPPPQAVPYFRTDTSSVVWTTPPTIASINSHPQDSSARQPVSNKSGMYQAAVSSSGAKSQVAHQTLQGLPTFYRHGLQQIPHQPSSREQSLSRGYSSYPQQSPQQPSSAPSSLPRINPPSVVNVSSTFTPRFSSPPSHSATSSYYGASRVPATLPSEEPRPNVSYSYASPKQTPTSTSNGMAATLPRVNFPSPTAVSFDASPSLPGANAFGSLRNSGMASVTPSSQQNFSGRHTIVPTTQPIRDTKVSLTTGPQSRHLAYAQVQSHAAYAQQAATLQSSQSRSTVSTSSIPQYTPASAPNHYPQQYRSAEAASSAVRYSSGSEGEYRPKPGHFASAPSRNPALETDSCRNPFELPPPSNYPRSHQGTSVIKSHHQGQKQEEERPVQRAGTYPYLQQRNEVLQTGMRLSDSVTVSRYSMPTEQSLSSASVERPRPPPISARFPPVPQMNYDLQRQIYDRMTGVQKGTPRLVEKEQTERRNATLASNALMNIPDASTAGLSGQSTQKKESPLDLSVKTVRQSADSTRDDVDLYSGKHSSDMRMATAPKVDFTPNFSGPLVNSDARNNLSLPPVQSIRTFVPSQTEPNSMIQSRKRSVQVPHMAPPPKTPKIDAWKVAMDEQIEERLKTARQSRSQPTAALTPINPPLQSTTPTNPELLRVPGYFPTSGFSNIPSHREPSPSQFHEKMLQQTRRTRETRENTPQAMHDWNLGHGKDNVSISKVPTSFPPDTRHIVQQISQGVMPDSKLLQDRSVMDVLRTSLEEKEARLQQLQDAARKKQRLPPFDSVSIERMQVPPSYKHVAPNISENVKIGVEPTQNYSRPAATEKPQNSADLDGLAAFLAARTIRTKAEMKQMGPSVAPFRSPDQGARPGVSGVSPPKLLKEGRSLTSPHRRRSGETPAAPPRRDPTGIRSSSETSVFDFRESDSEGEMPVLERQTLEGMRRDRKTQPKATPPQIPEPEPLPPAPEEPEPKPDPAWDNACDMFVEQLQKRPIKRSIRKKKLNPKFFANESEAPGFMKVKTEQEIIKNEPIVPEQSVPEKEATKPKSTQEVKVEIEESEEIPVPPIKEEDVSSSSSDELPIKNVRAKTVNRRGKPVQSESEWGSSDESVDSSLSGSESSSCSKSDSDSEFTSEPKGRRVQTRQQSKKIRPPARMKLRSKQRGASKKDDAFRPGWEDEVYKFKQQLRMPERLINVSKPRKRGATSLPDVDSDTDRKLAKSGKVLKNNDKHKKEEKGRSKKGGKTSGKKKSKKEDKDVNIFKGKNKERPSSAPPLTRRNSGIVTRGKEKIRNGASAAVRRSNKAVQNSKRHLNQGKKIRRKFRSGFDYIRKKKKPTRNQKEAASTESKAVEPKPEPKRLINSHNIRAELKSWVVNKGAGETVLHRAARLGYAEVAAFCLIKLKLKPSPRDHAGYTPLHEACSRGHLKVARVLLQLGASVSEGARGGIRPLHQAAENNYLELVRLLLSYGADPLLATYTGQTALSLTSQDDVRDLITMHLADVKGEDATKWPFSRTISAAHNPLRRPPSFECVPIDIEIEASSKMLPPLYCLPNDENNDKWLLVEDLVTYTQSKSVDALLSKLPGATKREVTNDDFRERAYSCNILTAPEATGSQVLLLRYDDAVRQLMDVELVTVSLLVDD